MSETKHSQDWGDIPANWKLEPAGEHIIIGNGGDPHTAGNVPVYGSGGSFRTCGEYKTGPAILVGRKGTIDNPQYIEGRFWNVDTAYDVKTKKTLLPKFYFYLATLFPYERMSGKTTLPSMTQDAYKDLLIPIPPLPEQERIASILGDLDDLIEKQGKLIEKKKTFRDGLLAELITGIRSVTSSENTNVKYSGLSWLGNIPQHWEMKSVKDEYDVVMGKMLQSTRKNPGETLETYLGAVNIRWKGINTSSKKKMWFNDAEKQKTKLLVGDVVVVEGGMAGTATIYKGELDPCYMQKSVNRCRTKGRSDNAFLRYWLEFVYYSPYMESAAGKTTIAHLTKEKLEIVPFACPPEEEQRAITAVMQSLDNELVALEQKHEKTKQIKAALLNLLITGKRRTS